MAFELHKFLQGHRRGGAIALLLLAVLFIGLIIVINYGLRGVRNAQSIYALDGH